MAQLNGRPRRWRTGAVLVAIFVAFGLLLTRCPANRDGMPGQLAQSMEESTGAARSGALALDMWLQRRSTTALTSVALTDARDEVVKAFKGIAELRAEDPVDVDRQRMLAQSMTDIIAQLNAAGASIRDVTKAPPAQKARDDLRAAADALESAYR
ncbi:hypothetical protein A5724_24345 [Mycobacterium sp. ACS1612]|uniref:hypothetical protein n=1 Tax=Mycobacterium sp. ACS1612 TaxID=1834117 RepID=UPI0007FE0470|nr:hypothetical protein [Mycobacterium sp. ACS1612]OBF30343.1 hypothetical protein A5724_24345 [Mycobacterium sp. ACS1612]